MTKRFQILSLDGGGLKGIFTSSFLTALEEITGKRIVEHFDLIAGTSTGGIIAIALGLGFSPKKILAFYKERGRDIFPAQSRWSRVLVNVKWVVRHKYPAEPLRQALQNYFGNRRHGNEISSDTWERRNGDGKENAEIRRCSTSLTGSSRNTLSSMNYCISGLRTLMSVSSLHWEDGASGSSSS